MYEYIKNCLFRNKVSFIHLIFIVSIFIIPPVEVSAQEVQSPQDLIAQIIVPYPDSLTRGDVPVYGLACGYDFKEYVLEYGAGRNPHDWILIKRSSHSVVDVDQLSTVNFDLVKTIPGNLGMWETGLSEYEYKSYDVDLPMGEYTLRLRVIGRSGKQIESVVNVQIGRVSLNCEASTIESPDGLAKISIPEHSLYEVAKVFSLTPLNRYPSNLDNINDFKLVSQLYRLQPAGEKFTQKVRLKIKFDKNLEPLSNQISICVFDPKNKVWSPLDSYINKDELYIEAYFEAIPEDFAVYGIFESPELSTLKEYVLDNEEFNVTSPILCENNFENGVEQWQNKHGSKGAYLEVVEQECSSGHCLKISNLPGGGSFAAQAYHRGYDIRRYPFIDFDYKINKDVNINLLVKVDGRWFDIVFTDNEKTYWDLNIEKAGTLDDVQVDGQWHHLRFNLFEMLKKHIEHFRAEEIVFADWDSTGFKQLEFGTTSIGAYYYIDNFRISSDQYFWQLGILDNSSKEFGEIERDSDVHYAVGEPLSHVPRVIRSSLEIVCDVPKNIKNIPYRLSLYFVKNPLSSNNPEGTIAYNNILVKPSSQLLNQDRIDVMIDHLSLGENLFLFNNMDGILELDSISLNPLGTVPWSIDSVSIPEDSEYYFIGEKKYDLNKEIPLNSIQRSKLVIYFNVLDISCDLYLELIPSKGKSASSWLDLKTTQAFMNDIPLKEIVSGNSSEPIIIPISKEIIKEGINYLTLKSVGPFQSLSFEKISLKIRERFFKGDIKQSD